MYFYIKNIPLFRGSYLITEVSHDIKTTGVETTFTGTRIPAESLPNPSDSFLASYRPLFDKLVGRANAIVNKPLTGLTSGTATTLIDGNGKAYTTDPSFPIKGEKILKGADVTEYGIPYNGDLDELYIQKVEYEGEEWLRAAVLTMDGPNYPIDEGVVMSLISNLTSAETGDVRVITWGTIKNESRNQSFYSSRFVTSGTKGKFASPTTILRVFSQTEFFNPNIDGKHKGIVTVPNKTNFTRGAEVFEGPINVGPAKGYYSIGDNYALGLSIHLMKRLALKDGQVVYFRMS